MRKQLLLEAENFKAAQKRKTTQEQLYLVAEKEWIPCQGTILTHTATSTVIDLYQTSLVPTNEISKLGFEREGPPNCQLNKFSAGSTFLRHVVEGLAIGDNGRAAKLTLPPTGSPWGINMKSRNIRSTGLSPSASPALSAHPCYKS